MTGPALPQLADLLEAAQRADAARLRDIRAQEDDLRMAIARLEARVSGHAVLPAVQWQGFHATGADMLWQRWAERTRRDLQMRLARVLAQKETAIAALRRSHGRSEAAARLVADHAEARRQARARQRALEEDGLVRLKAAERDCVTNPAGRYPSPERP